MTTRITTKTVVFSRAFVLNEADGEQQPGIYTVETEEEELDVMSISAYRRVSTVMTRYDPHGRGGLIRFVTIDPAELNAARGPDLDGAPAGLIQYEARLTGLKPDTQYYYAVCDGDRRLTALNPGYGFVTPPPRNEAAPVRFWVVGDSGTGRETQHSVYTAMLNQIKVDGRPLDFCLHLGGMAYASGRDIEFQTRFFEVYGSMLRQTVCWPTRGDEEGASSSSTNGHGPYYDAFVCPKRAEAGGVPSGTEAYYSFTHGPVHFICLNSHDLNRKATGPMVQWLKRDLETARTDSVDWIVAYFHHPPYSKGTHDSDREKQLVEMRTQVIPMLEAGGVDLVLSAHSHIYERSMLVDGAYATPSVAEMVVLNDSDGDFGTGRPYRKSAGIRPNGGTVYVVAGTGGATVGRKGTMPIMRKIVVEHGSVLIDINADSLQGRLINKFGEVRDMFGIIKSGLVDPRRLPQPWRPPPWTQAPREASDPPLEDFVALIPKASEWTYLAGGHPADSKWTGLDFAAEGWRKGPAPLGFGYREARTILDEMPGRYTTVYLRHEFELNRTDGIADLGLMINYDDAFIAYLNGNEVARKGVGQGHGREAREVKSHDASRHSYFSLAKYLTHLRTGRNVLAIEGHNASLESNDFLIDPFLVIEP
jgi:hypothetical protein